MPTEAVRLTSPAAVVLGDRPASVTSHCVAASPRSAPGGHVHCFLARKATQVDESQRLASDDVESKMIVKLSRRELEQKLLEGEL